MKSTALTSFYRNIWKGYTVFYHKTAVFFTVWVISVMHVDAQTHDMYGFSGMTEPRGVTLKSDPDISRLAPTRGLSPSLSVPFTHHSFLCPSSSFLTLPLSSLVHWQRVVLTNGRLSLCLCLISPSNSDRVKGVKQRERRWHSVRLFLLTASTTKWSTLIFLVCTIKQKLLLMSNFNSEQQQLDEVQQMDEICSIPPVATLI